MTSGPSLPMPRQALDGSPILTVAELNRAIREALERHVGLVWVVGEISNLRVPASGHCYLTLKDDGAQISAVLWRTTAALLRFQLKEGMSVIAQGEVTVYEPRGQYQIVLRRVEPVGLGALQLAFNQLKQKLAEEGLFDSERKRSLPAFPRKIAVVTSPTGAAVQDILRVLRSRFPIAQPLVVPVRVQGEGAALEIAEAIRLVNSLPDIDVMIVGRGGGSLEDLWAFNEEITARAIAASRVPVISAVGHETDFTIADFVADVRALTPTDAAHRAVPDLRQLLQGLGICRGRLTQALSHRTAAAREQLDGFDRHLDPRAFQEKLRRREQRLDDLCQDLFRSMRHRLRDQRQSAEALAGRLESLSPLNVLKRGYSMTFDSEGATLRDAASMQPGQPIRTRLAYGELVSRVEQVTPPPSK